MSMNKITWTGSHGLFNGVPAAPNKGYFTLHTFPFEVGSNWEQNDCWVEYSSDDDNYSEFTGPLDQCKAWAEAQLK